MEVLWTVIQLVLVCLTGSVLSYSDLLTVVVLYRHGDRSPIFLYPKDPYEPLASKIWPNGFGQLTNIGKRQQYAFGTWLRNRYNDFISPAYTTEEIKVLSSNADRCVMSATANLAGLYGSVGQEIWNPSISWQIVPVHTIPNEHDAILAMTKPCQKFKILYEELMETAYFRGLLEENQSLFNYLSENTGRNISDLGDMYMLYDTLHIEMLHDLTLPDWTGEVYPDKLKPNADAFWSYHTFSHELTRLKAGPLIDYIMNHLESVVKNATSTPKVLMLSAHEYTIISFLNSLRLYDQTSPQYAAAVIIELRRERDYDFVNIIYKNSVDSFANLSLKECEFDCTLNQFQQVVDPFRVKEEDWEKECLDIY